MSDLPITRLARQNPFLLVMVLSVTLVVAKAIAAGLGMEANFATMGNDDITRLVMVRDWIAGQGWYDTTQYRMAPPDGVLVHWSRYIDAGIAAIILPLSLFLPMETAEQIAATVWPTLILIVTLLVMGFGTRRLFGAVAACFAVLFTVLWPLTADVHARAGNLDHHNIQLLMMIILAMAAVWPTRPIAAGVVGGLAAAFSLSTGLEALLFIVGAGVVIFVRGVFGQTAKAARLLISFCSALFFGSVLLWLGLTAPNAWGQPVCDQLGASVLSLVAAAAVGSVLPFAVYRWISGPVMHIASTVIITAIGIALAWPLLGSCIEGPYGSLSPELQEMISSQITEAKPALVYVQAHSAAAFVFTLPVVTAMIAGFALWRVKARQGDWPKAQSTALGWLLILGVMGIGMMFNQMRTVIMVASIVPIIGGVVMAVLLQAYLDTRGPMTAVTMFAIAIAIASPALYLRPFEAFIASDNGSSRKALNDCRQYDGLTALNAIPPARILSPGNLGPALLWATHHSALSGLYHRSPSAMYHAMAPWRMDEAEFMSVVQGSNATHLLLCRGRGFPGAYATDLSHGDTTADWLRPVAVDGEHLMLFEILR
ncbi:hypothetical protein [Loktanella sp. Alg231-35]|uniref:hypothetical protein n=1 Tax=Loktanella sp. Alg231-35 TaxID=1922220 RepID=UPI000D55FE8F|nr:hypothetical protein [Loktanella sp. Alg231-35]